jgi:hypothetical protein
VQAMNFEGVDSEGEVFEAAVCGISVSFYLNYSVIVFLIFNDNYWNIFKNFVAK